MAELVRVLARISTTTGIDVETLKTLGIFCGLGLLVSLVCAMTWGLDLSAGFF
jgi:hypothetical protein